MSGSTSGPPARGDRARWLWLIQVVSGVLLVPLFFLHMIANHFVADEGLQTYPDMVQYLSNPFVVVLELMFLAAVTGHAALGVRAIVLDLGPSSRVRQVADIVLTVLGVAAVSFGIWIVVRVVAS